MHGDVQYARLWIQERYVSTKSKREGEREGERDGKTERKCGHPRHGILCDNSQSRCMAMCRNVEKTNGSVPCLRILGRPFWPTPDF